MSTSSLDPSEPEGSPLAMPAKGLLRIGLPHWTAEVHVFDNLFRPVAGVGPIHEEPRARGKYVTEVALPSGIYEVEVTLEGKTHSELVSVRAGQTAELSSDLWNDLKLNSPAPLAGTVSGRRVHAHNAEKWSREVTWKGAPGGDSRLFLFVRTLKPEVYGSFADGLALLYANGNPVTDFAQSARTNPRAGWMAFSADLPSGVYILRRARSGLRVRHQPVYLCAGWETHVFIAARRHPSLRTLVMNMARHGAGFRTKDEASIAAEAILESLAQSDSGERILNNEKIKTLLLGSSENPWLGILAAYALRRSREERGRKEWPEASESKAGDLLAHVLGALAAVGDHPDVCALLLAEDAPATAPFWCPPLLREGLKRVRRHATRFAETIPLGSLTDCVLDRLVLNSPWTAWRYLERLPLGLEAASRAVANKRLFARRPTAVPPSPPAAEIQSVQPKAPVYRLEGELEAGAPQASAAQTTSASAVAILNEAPLLEVAQTLTQRDNLDALPETVSLNRAQSLGDLLVNVEPMEVSAASGLPLARTEHSLENLRRICESPPAATGGHQGTATKALTRDEQFIIEYALQKSARLRRQNSLPEDETAVADEPSPQFLPPTTIEECVSKLREESARLLLTATTGSASGSAMGDLTRRTHDLAESLLNVADNLLKGADFTAITDIQGPVLFINGAFLDLLSPWGAGASEQSARRRPENQSVWEVALASTPLGRSTLVDPVTGETLWDLRRTAIEDNPGGTVQAYLNLLRRKETPPPTAETLEQVSSVLQELALYTSLLAYGTAERQIEYVDKLESLTHHLQQVARPAVG